MTQEQLEEEYWDDEQEPAAVPPTSTEQALLARRQQLLSKLRRDADTDVATGGRSSGGDFRGAMVPVRHAPLTEYQVPVQYIPVQQQRTDWIALALPGMLCFSALALGGMAIMAGNQPREHDAFMMAKLAEATKAVAERPASNNICIAVVCPAVGSAQPQPAQPVAAMPSSPEELALQSLQQYQANPVNSESYQQWLNYFQGQSQNLPLHLQTLNPQRCQGDGLPMCAALGAIVQQQQFGQPQQVSQFSTYP